MSCATPVLSSAGQQAMHHALQRLSELHYGSDAYAQPHTPASSDDEASDSTLMEMPDSTPMETPPRLRRARRAMSSPQHVQRIWVLQEEQRSSDEGLLDAQAPWSRRESLDDSRRDPQSPWL